MDAASARLLDGSLSKGVVHKNNLNTINGCYVPCLLNILGAVLYLRIGFSVGMMGLMGTLAILAFSESVAYLTISSFSAIVTNGDMRGGGAYFMISRNLGAAFGGASGLLFWFTYCINVTFNTVAFTDTFMRTFITCDTCPNPMPDPDRWSSVICSTITLFVLFLIAYKGAGTFAKVNTFIFFGLCVSLLFGMGSVLFASPAHDLPFRTTTNAFDGANHTGVFHKWSVEQLKTNLWPSPEKSDQCGGNPCTLNYVYGIIFPAVVGMMEGANLSGDLKDPSYSIPWGTVAAVSSAFFCYLVLMIGQAGSMDRAALQFNMYVMQDATDFAIGKGIGQYFIVLGVATACLSTSLGSMFGSSRILQAIARDDLIPALAFFKKGTADGDEPRRAVVFSYLIAQLGFFVGELDEVAPLLTNFFLITYALTNLATFLLEVSNLPNFRPTFRYYHWASSLLGVFLCLGAMFYLDPVQASATIAFTGVLFIYMTIKAPVVEYGDISQALLFQQARKFLLRMQAIGGESGGSSTKYWRPSLLLFSDDFAGEHLLLHFCSDLKKGGLFVLGRALEGDDMHEYQARVNESFMEGGNESFMSGGLGRDGGGGGGGGGNNESFVSTGGQSAAGDEGPEEFGGTAAGRAVRRVRTQSVNTMTRVQSEATHSTWVQANSTRWQYGHGAMWIVDARLKIQRTLDELGVKGFPHVIVAPTARLAYQNLVVSAGLGTMQPDTVVLPLAVMGEGGSADLPRLPLGSEEFTQVVRDVLDLRKNCVIAANFFACTPPAPPNAANAGSGPASAGGSASAADSSGSAGKESFKQYLRLKAVNDVNRIDIWLLHKPKAAEYDLQVNIASPDLSRSQGRKINVNSQRSKSEKGPAEEMNVPSPDRHSFDRSAGADTSGLELPLDMSLMLQLSYVLKRKYKTDGDGMPKVCMRLIQVVEGSSAAGEADMAAIRAALEKAVLQARLASVGIKGVPHYEVEILVLPMDLGSSPSGVGTSEYSWHEKADVVNARARAVSEDASVVMMSMPPLPHHSNAAEHRNFFQALQSLSEGLPPTLLVANGQGFGVITTAI
jgi:potassium/chloride transporter 9